jgi:X-Pro dipeptidyl-peptidase-like protein
MIQTIDNLTKQHFTTSMKNDNLKYNFTPVCAFAIVASLLICTPVRTDAQAVPIFEEGLALVVDTFANPDDWIREELWVETDFDSDGDGEMTDGELLVPGAYYEMTFELEPDDQIVPAGQRLGLMIFSSDREYTLQPIPGTELTIDVDGTSMLLPVVGGASAVNRALD